MKPLDLNVGIQNSYEAARVESVRIEKEYVLNRLAGEDSLREQRLRDVQVNPPQAKIMHDDMFSAEAYEAPDYSAHGDSEKKKHSGSRADALEAQAEDVAENNEKNQSGDSESQNHRFSTYA